MAYDTTPSAADRARDWVRVLSKYRQPNTGRSFLELGISIVPFLFLFALSCAAIQISPALAIGISVVNAGFLLRLFCIQHDCGHGSYFSDRRLNDWTGRVIGVLTLTPYDVWKRSHAIHHSHSGDLGHRGTGDLLTLTTREYKDRGPLGRLFYRAYRHPLVLFGLGPAYVFYLENRLPFGYMRQGWRYWVSALGTNLMVAVILGGMIWFAGWQALVYVFLPTTLVAASIGVWLFYIQHQFEATQWDRAPDWQVHEAALYGSSHYDLPAVLRWFSANIGIHHVHHLYSRIPFYRLTEVLRDHAELVDINRMTLRQSLSCVRLNLWDEQSRRLVSFAEARRLPA